MAPSLSKLKDAIEMRYAMRENDSLDYCESPEDGRCVGRGEWLVFKGR